MKALPRTVAVRTVYEVGNWSYGVQHGATWGSHRFSLSGLYSAPPTLDVGNRTLRGEPAHPPTLCQVSSGLTPPRPPSPLYCSSSDQLSSPRDQYGGPAGAVVRGPAGQRLPGLDETRPTGAGARLRPCDSPVPWD